MASLTLAAVIAAVTTTLPGNRGHAVASRAHAATVPAGGPRLAGGVGVSWGDNANGQLGQGAVSVNPCTCVASPGTIPSPSAIKQIVGGNGFTVALLTDGTVWTWGVNNFGQMGNNTTDALNHTTAIQATGLSNVIQIGAGSGSTVALKADGTVWAWGQNLAGVLGDNTNVDHHQAAVVHGVGNVGNLTNIVEIAEMGNNITAIDNTGHVYGWGDNTNCQLGINATGGNHYTPIESFDVGGVGNIGNVISATSSGWFSVLVKSDGTVWSMGYDNDGQLGDGGTANQCSPVQVLGVGGSGHLTGITSAASSRFGVLARAGDGTLYAWGTNNEGELGLGTSDALAHSTPTVVPGVVNASFIAASRLGYVIAAADGTVYDWGEGLHGEPGDGTTANRLSPFQVPGITNAAEVGSGYYSNFALVTPNSTVYATGDNSNGELGQGATPSSVSTRVITDGLGFVTQVQSGANFNVALKSDGTVWTWGSNSNGMLGDGTTSDRNLPHQIAGLTQVRQVAAGVDMAYALRQDGTVWSWGDNTYGQVGDNSTTERDAPVQVAGLTQVTSIAATRYSGAARRVDGSVWTWGNNFYGNLGNNTACGTNPCLGSKVPVAATVASAAQLFSGYDTVFAQLGNGSISGWGEGDNGEQCDGTVSNAHLPHTIANLAGAVKIVGGSHHTLAVTAAGTLLACGLNGHGQLGDGTVTPHTSPITVPGVTDPIDITAGTDDSFALLSTGAVQAWGAGTTGQLGNGGTVDQHSPVAMTSVSQATGIAAGDLHTLILMQGPVPTTTTLTSSANPSPYGSPVWFTATVTPQYGAVIPTGTVTFLDGAASIGTTTLDVTGATRLGSATLTAGTHSITAKYNADATNNVSFSPAISQVSSAPTTGPLWAWGENDHGELGIGNVATPQATPTLNALTPVQSASSGDYGSMALTSTGNVYTWGANGNLELGTGAASCGADPCTGSTSPVEVVKGACGACSGAFLDHIIQVRYGDMTAMALRDDGTVWEWGQNNDGQLGNNSVGNSGTPVEVLAGACAPCGVDLTGVVQIATTGHTPIALRNDGTVWAWGYDNYGQFGNNTTGVAGTPSTPVQVRNVANTAALTGIASVAAGGGTEYAVSSAGAMLAWGRGDVGQLGNGSTTLINKLPIQAIGSGVATVSGGGFDGYALLTGGTVEAWGDNASGQLGNGAASCGAEPCLGSSTPVAVASLSGITAVQGGWQSAFAISSTGAVSSWGLSSDWGELGTGSMVNSATPVTVAGSAAGDIAVYSGPIADHTMMLGKYQPTVALSSNKNPTLTGVVPTFTASVTGSTPPPSGGTLAFTDNGVGIPGCSAVAVAAPSCTAPAYSSAGGHVIVVSYSGDTNYQAGTSANYIEEAYPSNASTLFAWGDNSQGQLGDGTLSQRPYRMPVSTLGATVTQVSGDYYAAAAIDSSGNAWVWGYNNTGQSGTGANPTTTPFKIIATGNVVAITMSGSDNGSFGHVIALESDGSVWTWGDDTYGELGNNTANALVHNAPAKIVGLTAVGVTSTYYGDAILKSDGTVWTWGGNGDGELGNGTASCGAEPCLGSKVPVQVAGLGSITALSGGGSSLLALRFDGTVWAWGNNTDGQLGNGGAGTACGSDTCETTPVQSGVFTDGASVHEGRHASYVVTTGGFVRDWGGNYFGDLGNGNSSVQSSPVTMTGVTNPIAVAAGSDTAIVVLSTGVVDAIGYNNHGQLGNGNLSNSATLTTVNGLVSGSAASTGWYSSYGLAVAANFTASVVVTSNNNPSLTGQNVTFTATITGNGSPASNGTVVTFYNGVTSLGTGTVSAGIATLTISTLPVGTDSITATWAGDGNYGATTSAALSQVVNAGTTTTAVVSSGSPSTYDSNVTFTATVTFPGAIPSSENVTFCDGGSGGVTCTGGTLLGTGAINSGTGVATYTTALLSVGSHTILAYYPSDGTYINSSGTVAQIVNAGTLTVAAPGPLSMPLTPGTTSAATNLGSVSFTNTLGDQTAWSVTLGATDLCKAGVVGMPFSKMTISVDQSPVGGGGAIGALTPGAASQPLSGVDTTICSTFSSGTALLASGTGNSGDTGGTAGTWTMANNKITMVALGTANGGAYVGTVQYTITG